LGIGQLCLSQIAQGILTGKYRFGEPFPAGSRATDTDAPYIAGMLTADLLRRVDKLVPLARAADLTMAQMAVAWVLHNENLASAITGGLPKQVTENAAARPRR
jgi:aryl-alcohol dehydrogenase-like predicted oxidoreductase